MKIKIQLDRTQPTIDEINEGKNFSALIHNFNPQSTPFYKSKLFMAASFMIIISLVYITYYSLSGTNQNTAVEQKNEKISDKDGNVNLNNNLSTDIVDEKNAFINKTSPNNNKAPNNKTISEKKYTNEIQNDIGKNITNNNYLKLNNSVYAHINGKINGKIDYNNLAKQPYIKVSTDSLSIVSFKISYVLKNSLQHKQVSGYIIPPAIIEELKHVINEDKLTLSEITATTPSGKKINLQDLNFILTGTYKNSNETGVLEDELFEK